LSEDTKVDRLVRRAKDTPIFAKIIFVGLVLVVVGEFTESVDKIWSFVERRVMLAPRATDSGEVSSLQSTPEREDSSIPLPLDMNVLVFNAAKDPQAHTHFVKDFVHQYPGILVNSSSDWVQRYEMESSVVLFQGQRNES